MHARENTTVLRIAAVILLISVTIGTYAYPANRWKHIEGDHFVVSYNQRTKHLASKALSVAEETIETLTQYFGYPINGRKISIVLLDSYDNPNARAHKRDTVVTIDCRQTQQYFRSGTDWLRTALTHELSHIYSLAVLQRPFAFSTGIDIRSPAENFEMKISSYLGGDNVPLWFIEGIAQLGSRSVGADSMDPVRLMVLRDAARNGTLLSLEQMARFEGTSLDYELVYNQGFAFLLYLLERNPEVTCAELCLSVARYGIQKAFRASYRTSAEELWYDWVDHLSNRYSTLESWEIGQVMFPERTGRMILETSSVYDGDYVIATWGNDYTRFGLFRRTRDDVFDLISSDTGTVLKEDRSTKEIWFTKYSYSHKTGVDNLELFRIEHDGRLTQVTTGSRCLAFDAIDGHLVYAAYRGATTEILQRTPAGTEKRLIELSADLSVNSISLITPETAILSLGTPKGSRVAILAGGVLTFAWSEYAVSDAVYAEDDRVLFTATISGTPQIYWSDLADDPLVWYQITAAPAGARFPAIDTSTTDGIFFSVFERGGYRLYRAENVFVRNHPIRVYGLTADEKSIIPAKNESIQYRTRILNPVIGYPAVSGDLFMERSTNTSGVQSVLYGRLSALVSMYDAPEELRAQLHASISYPFLPINPLPPAISCTVTGAFDLGSFSNTMEYTVETSAYLPAQAVFPYTYLHQYAYAGTSVQLASRIAVDALYTFAFHMDTTDSVNEIYLLQHSGEVDLRYSYSPASVFDPALLGQPFIAYTVGAGAKHSSFREPQYFDDTINIIDRHFTFDAFADAAFRIVLFGGKLSLRGDAHWISYFEAVDGSRQTPYMLPTIGGSGSFSGYPKSYASVNDLGGASIELRTNPFTDRSSLPAWYQRLHLGARIDAGIVRYFDGGLVTGYPVSVEVSLRHYFYLVPNRQSTAYIRVAFPLNDFLDTITLPFQIYAGYSY